MGNNQTLIQVGSCGFFDTRKAHSLFANDLETYTLEHSMDKSLFIDTLSIDDNRNIKKLYGIMDLARRTQTLSTLIVNLQKAYKKLSDYHRGERRASDSIVKNSNLTESNNGEPFPAIDEVSSQNEESFAISSRRKRHSALEKQRQRQSRRSERVSQQNEQKEDQRIDMAKQNISYTVNLSTVQPFSSKFENLYQRVLHILTVKRDKFKQQHLQEIIEDKKNVNKAGTGEQHTSQRPSVNSIVFSHTPDNQLYEGEQVFHVSMEQFFFLFQKAENELVDEREKFLAKMRPKNRIFGGCVDCTPCTQRPRDKLDEDYFLLKGIAKKKQEQDKWSHQGEDYQGGTENYDYQNILSHNGKQYYRQQQQLDAQGQRKLPKFLTDE